MKKMPFSLHVNLDKFIPATEQEKEYMVQMRPSSTFFKDGVKRLLKNKVATVSLLVVVIITLSSIPYLLWMGANTTVMRAVITMKSVRLRLRVRVLRTT